MKLDKHIVERTIELFVEGCVKADTARMAQEVYPSDVSVISDIPYIDDGNVFHVLDFYVPKALLSNPDVSNQKYKKIAIDIHGGGFVYGQKEINKNFNMTVASISNVPVVSINYQLCPTVSIVAQLNEIRLAFEFLIKNYGVEDMVIMGDSAGGYLALASWALLTEESIKSDFKCSVEVSDVNVSGLVIICPSVTDGNGFIRGIEEIYFGDDESNKMPLYGRDLCELLKRIPATVPHTVLITGDKDFLEKDTNLLYNVLKERGGKADLFDSVTKEGGNELFHVFCVGHPEWEESKEPLELIRRLLVE